MIDIYIARSRLVVASYTNSKWFQDSQGSDPKGIFELTASHEPGCGGSIDNERHCWGLPRVEINGINMKFNK